MATYDLGSGDVLRTLLEQSVSGIYILDLDGTIRYINGRFAELCGSSPELMIGHVFLEYVAPEHLERRRAAFAQLVSGEAPTVQQIGTFTTRDGRRLELLTQSSRAIYDGRPAIVGIATDVTESRRIERALERANHALRILGEGNSALVRAADEGQLLQEMCNIALATGAYSMAFVGLADHDSEKRVRAVAAAGVSTETLDGLRMRWDDSEYGRGPTGTAIRTGQPVLSRQSELLMLPWRVFVSANDHRAVLALPLMGARAEFGALTLISHDAQAFGDDELALLNQLAADISYGLRALRDRAAVEIERRRAQAHAARLEGLWKIVNNPRLSGDELILAMLAESAKTIRPGLPYVGLLHRIAGDEVVVEAVAPTAEYEASVGGVVEMRVGNRAPLADTPVVRAVLERGPGTYAWDDLQASFEAPRVRANQWRSAIATMFESGRATYQLWFASTLATGAWEPEDHAYVEILASFFASNAQARWQFDQLRYHQTHDVLTGMLNRSQFRSQARMASIGMPAFAVVAVNVNGFGEVNERYGNMIGDALLVEVAAGLSERALPGEITGRLGGDTFAVFIPQPPSIEYVHERAVHFAQRFQSPFSTGDREGKEFIPLTASFGMAVAPEHGTALDAIISHASVAVSTAKARGRGTILLYDPGMDPTK